MWNALEPFLYDAALERQRELLVSAGEAPPPAETAARPSRPASVASSCRPAICPWIVRRVGAAASS